MLIHHSVEWRKGGGEGRGEEGREGGESKAVKLSQMYTKPCYIMLYHLLLDMLLHALSVLLALFELLHHL